MSLLEHVPNVVFKTRVRDEAVDGPNPFRWQDLSTEEIFKSQKVILFSLPENGVKPLDLSMGI